MECGGLFTLSFEGPPLLRRKQFHKSFFLQSMRLKAAFYLLRATRRRGCFAGDETYSVSITLFEYRNHAAPEYALLL